MRLVIALGGNALLHKNERPEADIQHQRVKNAARLIAREIQKHELVLTHGNGPQVGLLALQAEACKAVKAYPLDLLDAESAGMIGYLLVQELHNQLLAYPVRKQPVALLTQVVVDRNDPAFARPDKPIGGFYPITERDRLIAETDWDFAETADGLRRVVPSPAPREIVELETIRLLFAQGRLVICAGGGGIPAARNQLGQLEGIAAVVDKDLSSALLATELGVDRLIMLTDVPAVYNHWGQENPIAIPRMSVNEARQYHFSAGTMAPKVEAACRFVEATGKEAQIGSLDRLDKIIAGQSGTLITS